MPGHTGGPTHGARRSLDHRVSRRGRGPARPAVGTHAYGDRAVHTLLDVYERVVEHNPGLPA
ncbi:hypothetical protein ACFRAO_31885 [Streptomyces sp. NPDC056656]|uniref:hypothetical protein n=1 Tax=Streptomyces sp. NPDC056656 TaxID=3345895 RepID=UPI0036C09A99